MQFATMTCANIDR